uniref:Uncharacterized protein n=1 Tax=Solanum lycopersicum TaxID=4081 RepID=A0A3Q7I1Z9_SOLLC
ECLHNKRFNIMHINLVYISKAEDSIHQTLILINQPGDKKYNLYSLGNSTEN